MERLVDPTSFIWVRVCACVCVCVAEYKTGAAVPPKGDSIE